VRTRRRYDRAERRRAVNEQGIGDVAFLIEVRRTLRTVVAALPGARDTSVTEPPESSAIASSIP